MPNTILTPRITSDSTTFDFVAGTHIATGKPTTITAKLVGFGYLQAFACYTVNGRELPPIGIGRGKAGGVGNPITFTPANNPGPARILLQHMAPTGARVSQISIPVVVGSDYLHGPYRWTGPAIGIVSITSPWHSDTPCTSKWWAGGKPWVDVLTMCGVQYGREWLSVVPGVITTPDWSKIAPYDAAGINVFHAFVPKLDGRMPTDVETIAAANAYVKSRPSPIHGMKVIEIGNEITIGKYWIGTARDFVERVLKPAYAVFHAAGYMVVLGGLNGAFANEYKKMIDAGAGPFHDRVGIHPYSKTAAEFAGKYDALEPMLNGKPVWETESRVFLGQESLGGMPASSIMALESDQWAERKKREFIEASHIYVGDVRGGTTGPLGLFITHHDNNQKITGASATVYFDEWFFRTCRPDLSVSA